VKNAVLRKIIGQLRRELQEISYALWSLEALARGKPRRGRPPKIAGEIKKKRPKKRRSGAGPAKKQKAGRQAADKFPSGGGRSQPLSS